MRGWRFGPSRMPEHRTSPCKMPRDHFVTGKASVGMNNPASRLGELEKRYAHLCLHSLDAASPMSSLGQRPASSR
jgi:hypothetical protein